MSRWLVALALLLPLAAAQGAGRLDRIQATGRITLAYAPDAPPFSLRGADGQPDGYSIELCRRVAAGIQARLGLKDLEIRWIGASTPERLALVAQGKVDLECGVTTRTLSREAQVGFSLPIFIDGAGLLVPKGSPIVALPGLDGRWISVVGGTTTEQHLREVIKQRGLSAELVTTDDRRDAFAMLDRGDVQAYAGDRAVLIGQASTTRTRTPEWTLLDLEISYEPYAFAVPRGDPALRLEVDRAIAAVYRSGGIDDIYGRWFGRFGPPQPLLKAMYLLNRIPE